MYQAMAERKKTTIIEAYFDPFESAMSPKVEMSFVKHLAESFARRQPYASRVGLTLFRNQVHNIKKIYIHFL
jgi:pyruvate dehydrogenase (quinone)